MMHKLTTLMFFIPGFLFGQIDFENQTWHLPCDSSHHQQDMNVCSNEKSLKADSLMDVYYQSVLTLYSREIADLVTKDDIESDSTMYVYYKDLLKSIKRSQTEFIKYRESLIDVESIDYQGGSIMPLMINMAYLRVTIERIRWLESKKL